MTLEMHDQLARIWPTLDRDPGVRAVLVCGSGDTFSAGGDFEMLQAMVDDEEIRSRVMDEARALVVNMIECSTPIVSAIAGHAVGAGLAVALLADISVAARNARLLDGHVRLGVPAGDHAVLVWPLLCGIAKAKRYLLLPDEVTGAEAERIGLVSMCVPDEDVTSTATELAERLARSSAPAVARTKRALNGWLDEARPRFDASLALEFLGFSQAHAREGLAALRERREPRFERATESGN